ncbi:hypothetical protein, partial [Cupriavidus pinatubonensis]|uniref:hypothetical protein n=1 Tax=Cupriavidus pinatubonensis TaxID=248026 RepID=UPI00361B4EBE
LLKKPPFRATLTGFAVCVAASAAEKQDFKVFSTINQAFSRNFFFFRRLCLPNLFLLFAFACAALQRRLQQKGANTKALLRDWQVFF